jgi:hypothetical protein
LEFFDKLTIQARGEALGPQCAALWDGLACQIDRGMFTNRVQLDFGFKLADVAVTNRAETA